MNAQSYFRLGQVCCFSAGTVLVVCDVEFPGLFKLRGVRLLRDREDPNRYHVQAGPLRTVNLKPELLAQLRAALLAEYRRHQNGEVA